MSMQIKNGFVNVEFEDNSIFLKDKNGQVTEYEVFPENNTLSFYSRSEDYFYSNKEISTYDIKEDLESIKLKLIKKTYSSPEKRVDYIVDNQLQEDKFEDSDKEPFMGEGESFYDECKERVKGSEINLYNNYFSYLLILEKAGTVLEENFRDFLRKKEKEITFALEKIQHYLDNNKEYEGLVINQDEFGTRFSSREDARDMNEEERDELWKRKEDIENKLFNKKSQEYVGIPAEAFYVSHNLLEYIDFLLKKPKSRNNPSLTPNQEDMKRIKKKNNKIMWLHALLPSIFIAIVISWIFQFSFIGAILIGLIINIVWEIIKLISSTIIYNFLGGKSTQIETFYTLIKTTGLPKPTEWDIDNPIDFYKSIVENIESNNNQIAISTYFNAGVEIARSAGAWVRVLRIINCHKEALKRYQQD